LIFQQRGWGKTIGRFLAKKLSEEEAVLAALTFKKSTDELIRNQPGVKYELIIENDAIMSDPAAYLAGDVFSFEEICGELGIDSIWHLAYTLRNHVKSYREKYYYSFRQNVSDEGIELFIKAVYKYMKVFFSEFKPDVIIAPNFVALPHIIFNLYAKKNKIPMFAITSWAVKGFWQFTYNYQDSEGPFFKRLDDLNNQKEKSSNQNKARSFIETFRAEYGKVSAETPKKLGFRHFLKKELSPYYQCFKWWMGKRPVDYVKATGITVDYRPPKILLRDHYMNKYQKWAASRFQFYPLEKVGKCVYFPLQFQPEANIDVIAPNFSNQIETARQVAMSLPGDYTLVVKEHPEMVGLRPMSYWEKVARTPNVKFIDYRTPTVQIFKKADLIVSPNGTTIGEAAFFCKPVIQLGNLGTTMKLPNVFKHTDFTALPRKIKEVLSINLRTEDYEGKLENYVAAIFDAGSSFNYGDIWSKGAGDKEELWRIYKRELDRIFS